MATSLKTIPGCTGRFGSRPKGLLALLLVLLLSSPALAQDRTELVNRSNQPWTLALVEGHRPGRGSLTLVDKFTGHTAGTLVKVGDAVRVPAHGRLLVVFNRDGGYVYKNFILKDRSGYYAEYLATVEFLSSPQVSINMVDHHLGPPLDQADEGVVLHVLGGALEIGSENIVIHPNALSDLDYKDGKTVTKLSSMLATR